MRPSRRIWSDRTNLFSIPEEAITAPLGTEEAHELRSQLDTQAATMHADELRIASARTSIEEALGKKKALDRRCEQAIARMENEEDSHERRHQYTLDEITSKKSERETEVGKMDGYLEQFNAAAGNIQLAVVDPGNPQEVVIAAYRRENLTPPDYLLQESRETPPAATPPADPEPDSPHIVEPEKPADPEPRLRGLRGWLARRKAARTESTATSRHQRSIMDNRLVGVYMFIAPWVSGMMVAFGVGIILGLITEATFNPIFHFNPFMPALYAFGVAVAFFIAFCVKKLTKEMARPRDPEEIRPRLDILWIGWTFAAALVGAEIYANTKGLMFREQIAANDAALQQLPFTATPWQAFALIAMIVNVPYFLGSALEVWDTERGKLRAKLEETEEVRRQHEAEMAKHAAEVAKIEADAQTRLAELEASERRHEAEVDRLAAQHRKVTELLATSKGQEALKLSGLIGESRRRVAALELRLEELQNERLALEAPLEVPEELAELLRRDYLSASEAAHRAYRFTNPNALAI